MHLASLYRPTLRGTMNHADPASLLTARARGRRGLRDEARVDAVAGPMLETGFACKPGDRSIRTQDVRVTGRGGPILARVYTRPDVQPGAPAILFIHGGGFIDFGIDLCDNVQRGLAARTGYVVVGLSYRLAPEHPFPAALENCRDVLR